ncbi:peptidase C1B bleomycin hydrolase [Mrakia frigida]|uniref:bleomycin hydrolase n=1 Tax=Mrakia frigida TaxID=29902 RepID=UPI003FCC0FC3
MKPYRSLLSSRHPTTTHLVPNPPFHTPSHSTMGSSQSKVEPSDTLAVWTEKTAALSVASSSSSPPSYSGPPPTAELLPSKVNSWQENFDKDPKNLLAQTILSHTDIPTALLSRSVQIKDTHVYNTTLAHDSTIVTNQASSGRCWLFATTNVCRLNVTKSLKLKDDFELSQSYLFFYDKCEKANYFLESSIELADEPLDSRIVSFLSQAPINDGGQQDMAAGLIEKYGFIPKSLYPESYSSSNSSRLNTLLTSYLRQSALGLRKLIASGASKEDVRRQKEANMEHVYKVLAISLGSPPKPDVKFLFEYYDKDGKFGKLEMTPLEFSKKYAGPYPYVESFSLIHDPRNAYNQTYGVDRLGNIWNGRKVLYVNAEINRLKDAVVKSMLNGQSCFFGCDVGAFSSRGGEMDLDIYDYKTALDLDFTLTKAERLQLGDSAMTHAMVITAVHLDEKTGKPIRYRVENSWSDAAGQKGFMVMTDAWFEQFVYQVVIHKNLADADLLEVLKKKPVILDAWDPLGALA